MEGGVKSSCRVVYSTMAVAAERLCEKRRLKRSIGGEGNVTVRRIKKPPTTATFELSGFAFDESHWQRAFNHGN